MELSKSLFVGICNTMCRCTYSRQFRFHYFSGIFKKRMLCCQDKGIDMHTLNKQEVLSSGFFANYWYALYQRAQFCQAMTWGVSFFSLFIMWYIYAFMICFIADVYMINKKLFKQLNYEKKKFQSWWKVTFLQ